MILDQYIDVPLPDDESCRNKIIGLAAALEEMGLARVQDELRIQVVAPLAIETLRALFPSLVPA